MSDHEERVLGPRRRMVFTDLALRRLTVPDDRKQVLWWDTKTRGLSVLVSSGGTRTFRATFGLNGRYITDKIGRVGEMPLGDARTVTADYRNKANQGIDPRRPKVSPLSYEDVVDRYIEQHAKHTQRSWQQTERTLKRNCAGWLNKPIAEITKHDARSLVRGFVAQGHLGKASVTKSWIIALWKWAASEGLVPSGVMSDFGVPITLRPRDRFYTDQEIKAIWNAADQLDPIRGAYFKLLLLLAPRKSALAAMRHPDITEMTFQTTRSKSAPKQRALVWTTPFEKTKSRGTSKQRVYLTPLPPLAERIITGLPKRNSDDRVFPGMPLNPQPHFARQLKMQGAPADFSYHTCRHTTATWLTNNGASLFEVGLILNHSSGGVTAGYSHGHSIPLKLELLTEWADHVAQLVQPEGAVLLR